MRSLSMSAAAAFGVICFAASVQAMPASVPTASGVSPTLVAEGCGRGFHRIPTGRCVPDGVVAPRRECPRGMHLGPEGRECRPNL